jgi:hypothetical protein
VLLMSERANGQPVTRWPDERLDGEGPDPARLIGREVMGLVFHFGSAYGRISVLGSAAWRRTEGRSARFCLLDQQAEGVPSWIGEHIEGFAVVP